MVVRVVGAGLPRTGTSSLREALSLLLGGPVYHMREAFQHPEHTATWVAATRGAATDWDAFLAGYVAGVDTPFSTCWRDLAAAYPEAPVLLSRRSDADVWWRSVSDTVLPGVHGLLETGDADPMAPLLEQVLHGAFGGGDPAAARAGYERRLADVRAEVPAARLVEWQPGDGWEPLCAALGVPVPDLPFPHENSTAAFRERAGTRTERQRRRQAQEPPPST